MTAVLVVTGKIRLLTSFVTRKALVSVPVNFFTALNLTGVLIGIPQL